MNILIVDNYTKHLNELQKLLSEFQVSLCKKDTFPPNDIDKFDIVLFSGGSGINVLPVKDHKENYIQEIDFIQKTNKKVVGICLGCEIIAVAFDCSLKELPRKEKGIIDIKFKNKTLSVYEAHRFAIENVNDEIEVLATSKDGIEMIKHKTKPIYGLQFHPEMFVEKTEGSKMFFEILKNI